MFAASFVLNFVYSLLVNRLAGNSILELTYFVSRATHSIHMPIDSLNWIITTVSSKSLCELRNLRTRPIINLACCWCTVAAAGWPVSHPCTDRFCQSTTGDVTHSWWHGTAGQKPAGFRTCEVMLTDHGTAVVGHSSVAATCSNDILRASQ